jgi:hypothetical protein
MQESSCRKFRFSSGREEDCRAQAGTRFHFLNEYIVFKGDIRHKPYSHLRALAFILLPKLSDLLGQHDAMIDWMPVEDPAFIGDPSSRTRSGAGMTGTHWNLFVIPAKSGI